MALVTTAKTRRLSVHVHSTDGIYVPGSLVDGHLELRGLQRSSLRSLIVTLHGYSRAHIIGKRTERHDILVLSQDMLLTTTPANDSLQFSFLLPRERPPCSCDLDARRELPPSVKVPRDDPCDVAVIYEIVVHAVPLSNLRRPITVRLPITVQCPVDTPPPFSVETRMALQSVVTKTASVKLAVALSVQPPAAQGEAVGWTIQAWLAGCNGALPPEDALLDVIKPHAHVVLTRQATTRSLEGPDASRAFAFPKIRVCQRSGAAAKVSGDVIVAEGPCRTTTGSILPAAGQVSLNTCGIALEYHVQCCVTSPALVAPLWLSLPVHIPSGNLLERSSASSVYELEL